jgi:hypothetical protein
MPFLFTDDLERVRELHGFLAKYSEDQPRDDHGRFSSGGGGGTAERTEPSRIGKMIRGDANNAKLANLMYDYREVSADMLENTVGLEEQGDAKAGIVASLGPVIATAAGTDGSPVQEEMLAWYPPPSTHEDLVTDILDSSTANIPPTYDELDKMSTPELYGMYKAQQFIDNWATTAADNDFDALAMQTATARALDAPSASFDKLERDLVVRDTDGPEPATMEAFVHGEYNATQDYLRQAGIGPDDYVTLYRGVHYGMEDVPSPFTKDGTYKAETNPASSWSLVKDVARGFAAGPDTQSSNSFVLTTQVKASDIISTSKTGRGALVEAEVLTRNPPGGLDVYAERQTFDQYGNPVGSDAYAVEA